MTGTDLTDRVVPVVVADDLTGATDTAVQFARTGWEIELLLTPTATGATGSAFAVTSDVRALVPAAAQDGTRAAVADALSRAPRAHVYLKIDSTMRGPVAAQIAGALEAWRAGHVGAFAVVCPAYPEVGRTVEEGVLRVNGAPVAETALRHDPVSPMTVSDLPALLPGALPLTRPGERPAEAVARHLADPASPGTVFFADARTRADLEALGRALATHPRIIPVGSAGLAIELSRCWHPDPEPAPIVLEEHIGGSGALLQVSSLNPVSRGQLAHLREAWPGTVAIVEPDLTTARDAEAVRGLCTRRADEIAAADLVVIAAPEDRGAAGAAAEIADALGAATARLVTGRRWAAVGLVGGDGARAVLEHLGVDSMRVIAPIAEGMPVSIISTGPASGTPIFTKAGGFGSVDALTTALQRLLGRDDRRTL